MTFMYQHHERFYLQILPGTHMAQLCLQYFDMSMCLDKQSPSDALALHSSGFLSSQKKSTDDKKKMYGSKSWRNFSEGKVTHAQ